MKYIIIIAVVLGGLLLWTGAQAATKWGLQFPRATMVGVVEEKEQWPIMKLVDGGTTCYTFKASISCVK